MDLQEINSALSYLIVEDEKEALMVQASTLHRFPDSLRKSKPTELSVWIVTRESHIDSTDFDELEITCLSTSRVGAHVLGHTPALTRHHPIADVSGYFSTLHADMPEHVSKIP